MNTQAFRSKLVTGLIALVACAGVVHGAAADSRDRGDNRGSHYARGHDSRNGDRGGRRADDRRYDDRRGSRDIDRRYDDRRGSRDIDRRYDDRRYDDRRVAGVRNDYRGRAYYDPRWQHRRYYPPRGYVAPALPRNVVVVRHRHYNYWYGGGVWYRPYGPRYVVVAPPLGIYVSFLPSYYTTVWFGGIPYYYANDAYYVWRAPQRAYEVVEPPPAASVSTVSPAAEDIFVYPREGQGPGQVAADRYECHRWASDETGFDPTRPDGGVPADQTRSLREAYQRAMTACLEGRGYSVR